MSEDPLIIQPGPSEEQRDIISAVDISSYPEISMSTFSYKDAQGTSKDLLDILSESGVNTVRLRLWVDPEDVHSGFEEVKELSQRIRAKGFKLWLSLHYSDHWADPGKQVIPDRWSEMTYSELKDEVYQYTSSVVEQMSPDYVQIGNEINNGFIHPHGEINNNSIQFYDLLATAISAVRDNSSNTEILLHFAGIEGSSWFFDKVQNLDYDIIGLSYYPIWHGKSMTDLRDAIVDLSTVYNKKVIIAETAYPFTLAWNDWTDNIVGQEDQLILPDFPASTEGQRQFIAALSRMVRNIDKGMGICYWGAELVAWKGENATDASPWENQALFDFQFQALPALLEL